MRQNYLIALSWANLVYLRSWADLLPLDATDLFYRKSLSTIGLYMAVTGDVLALSIPAFLLIRFAPKFPRWLQQTLLVAAIVPILAALHSVIPAGSLSFGLSRYISPRILVAAAAVIVGGLASLAITNFSRTLGLARAFVLAASPCLAVTFAGGLIDGGLQSPLPPDPPLASPLSAVPPVRVLWMIFDEWDQRLTFLDRPAGTSLPVIDRLANNSFTATHALGVEAGLLAVSQMATADAVPMLLYGRHLTPEPAETAAIRHFALPGGGRLAPGTVLWNESPIGGPSIILGEGASIFSRMHSLGWNSAIAGWYLPYCRVFAPLLTQCYWDIRYLQASSASASPGEAAVDETRMLFETAMTSVLGPSLVSQRHAGEYSALLSAARKYAADPSLGFAFIHFNVPHIPYSYDPKVGRFGHYGYSDARYNDALKLVDRTIGDILLSLQQAGLDSNTAIILSSDHPARWAESPYVPFFVHLPGELGGAISTREFSTLKTADLVVALAKGEIKSPFDVENHLGIHRSPPPQK